MLGHLKINRAIATRYDQLVDSFLGMLYLATAHYWIKFVHATQISSLRVGEKLEMWQFQRHRPNIARVFGHLRFEATNA
jgi:hypothetical protein